MIMSTNVKQTIVTLKSFSRANAIPLDASSVWDTIQEATAYAKYNGNAYAGQQISVIENGITKMYVLQKSNEGGFDLIAIGDAVVAMDSYYSFPPIGNSNSLYIDKGTNKAYRWDSESLKYYAISSDYNDIELIVCGDANTED